ncbi:MAG: MBOAT family O-acyltransferase [Lachnospiraceae bacterium]|nr:MBOAT family O-acyltransferase [Lachnospiraceae bacterium]
MSFQTIPFIFLFLPVALILYRVIPDKLKDLILVILSLLFYAWGDIAHLPVLIFSMAFNYLAGAEIDSFRRSGRDSMAKTAVITSTAADLVLLGFYKYTGFFLSIFGVTYTQQDMPIGISFFTFTVLSYIFDIYYGKAEPEKNIIHYAVYVSFFPKIISGPITEYGKIRDQLADHPVTWLKFRTGLQQFLIGLFKKLLLADKLGETFQALQNTGDLASASAWLGMVCYSLQLFYDFSGYSDMAIGLARMFGFSFDANFDHPYISDGVTDFWRRWHISLGQWFRDYVYIPMGGNRCSSSRLALNLLVVWILTGFWHGASWNFIFWGLYHGAWVLLDRFLIRRFFDRIPKPVRVGCTVLIAFFGWVFFFSPSLGSAFHWFGMMFGSAHLGFWNGTTTYYLKGILLVLIPAIIFCSPKPGDYIEKLSLRDRNSAAVSIAGYVFLFFVCIAAMVSSTYTSFLYFKF